MFHCHFHMELRGVTTLHMVKVQQLPMDPFLYTLVGRYPNHEFKIGVYIVAVSDS